MHNHERFELRSDTLSIYGVNEEYDKPSLWFGTPQTRCLFNSNVKFHPTYSMKKAVPKNRCHQKQNVHATEAWIVPLVLMYFTFMSEDLVVLEKNLFAQ